MRPLRSQYLLTTFTLALPLLAGCSTRTPKPPATTPPQSIITVEDLSGVWDPQSDNPDAMFLQISSDGTCLQSFSLEGLADAPQAQSTCVLEESNLVFTAFVLSGVQPCASPTSKYEVRSMGPDQIQLVAIEESCSRRRNSTQYTYQRLP